MSGGGYEPCLYTERVLQAVSMLREQGEWGVRALPLRGEGPPGGQHAEGAG